MMKFLIDIPNKKISLLVSDEEIEKRKSVLKPIEKGDAERRFKQI